MHPKVWENIEHRINNKEYALMHFVRRGITTLTIPSGSNSFDGAVFPTAADLPYRLVIFILDNGQYQGDRYNWRNKILIDF